MVEAGELNVGPCLISLRLSRHQFNLPSSVDGDR